MPMKSDGLPFITHGSRRCSKASRRFRVKLTSRKIMACFGSQHSWPQVRVAVEPNILDLVTVLANRDSSSIGEYTMDSEGALASRARPVACALALGALRTESPGPHDEPTVA